ncbi:hypothetical protein V5O48_016568 [Marasmius crinis-equi]|uniref:Uncharacterized protein n=1 Tax=Marasmius crinis-equi TaxID=585013 RepID=A0ABR3ERC2_9AGAR
MRSRPFLPERPFWFRLNAKGTEGKRHRELKKDASEASKDGFRCLCEVFLRLEQLGSSSSTPRPVLAASPFQLPSTSGFAGTTRYTPKVSHLPSTYFECGWNSVKCLYLSVPYLGARTISLASRRALLQTRPSQAVENAQFVGHIPALLVWRGSWNPTPSSAPVFVLIWFDIRFELEESDRAPARDSDR